MGEGAVVVEGTNAQKSRTNIEKKATHRAHKSSDGKTFYEDLESKKTTWELPKDAVVISADEERAAKNEAVRKRRSSFKGRRRMSAKQSFRVSDMDKFGKSMEQEF